MARTTVVIEDKLLKEAKKATGESTIRGTVNKALEEVVRRQHIKELLALKGSGIVSLTPEELEKMRANE
ncbi:MAG: type II toxin-antitoxin system VapB family antitoxin [Actinobacteria bacterium]|nr:type II toxin-antitoxin system VapB family antitoxin [Actinomycetota bacterium]MCG2819126.1 type II toxin-antitoxin system VapB family antitoxin [Actinomycetes bacterium]MBU4179920.1 type II toxin-antitoxin system VapB family antitoxin [Actinomycetota bacterium]MBU4218733.1 type II toxin-antitoxin system VapB family antitoxin [Actinomycetota bacterium]MBU4359462.1 type II toxin-antitoxin system VapB family antitoxin [Actinomycetota bacterium]